MQVDDKIMYHFHKNIAGYNDIWVKDNEFVVDNNFQSNIAIILKHYSTAVNTTDGDRQTFVNIIDYYLKEEQNQETYIKLLKKAKHLLIGANLFKRETALEEIRKLKYPNLPSRKHVIWLSDEKQLEFWEKELSHDYNMDLNLFKVSVSGTLFKTSDSFIPNNFTGYESNLNEAEKYWNPVFENEKEENRAEYLFQGKVKVLDKLK